MARLPAQSAKRRRSIISATRALLGQVDLFAGLEKVTLAKLAAYLQPLSYESGSIIFRQAEPGRRLLSGRQRIGGRLHDRQARRRRDVVEVLRAGEPFGEMALLTNSPSTASIKAETDCEVLRLERGAFLDLVRQQPSVALAIAATLSRRWRGRLDPPNELDDELAAAAPLRRRRGDPGGRRRRRRTAAMAAGASRSRARGGRRDAGRRLGAAAAGWNVGGRVACAGRLAGGLAGARARRHARRRAGAAARRRLGAVGHRSRCRRAVRFRQHELGAGRGGARRRGRHHGVRRALPALAADDHPYPRRLCGRGDGAFPHRRAGGPGGAECHQPRHHRRADDEGAGRGAGLSSEVEGRRRHRDGGADRLRPDGSGVSHQLDDRRAGVGGAARSKRNAT